MAKLEQNESIEIEGRKGRWYFLSRHNDIYSCTCVSFMRNREPYGERSCKHIDKFLKDSDDEEYIVEARRIAKMRAAGQRVSLGNGIGKGAVQTSHPQMIVDPEEIEKTIERLSCVGRLWLDTEVADWKSGCGRLSLIQVLSEDSSGASEDALVLDVLHYPDLIERFISEIMMNASIEKVFHYAAYDRQYLGQERAVCVSCTHETAKFLAGRSRFQPKAFSLKSLAEHFGLTKNLDKTEQKSDWSVRPLSHEQIEYAIMDVVFLRGIDLGLQQLMGNSGETLIKREHDISRKSRDRRDVMEFDPQKPSNGVQFSENTKVSQKLPTDVHLTWYLLSKGATVTELANTRGGEPRVYNHLVAAIGYGKEVDIRTIVNRSMEKKLMKIWQQLPSKKRTPKGLHEASGLSLPSGAFKCVVALFKNAESGDTGGNPECAVPVRQSSTKVSVPPKRVRTIGTLKIRAKRKARVAIQVTDEQLLVLDSFKNQRSLKIHAFAGAGKTQTLVEAGNSTTRKGLYLSFNKKNAAEASKRFPPQVDCMTTHGLAFRTMRKSFSDEKLTQAVTVSAIRNGLNLGDLILHRRWTPYEIATLTLGMLRDWLRSPEESLDKALLPNAMILNACTDAEKYELRDHCSRLADRCWQLMKSNTDAIPLSHDGYLKLWASMQPEIEADYIMLDEAQDSNAIILDVLARQSCQKIMVGDRHQQIYEWRGAVDAMTQLHADDEQFLTQTFRFGDEIAVYANAALQRLNESRTLRVFGASSPLATTTACRAFLARTNATVIKELMARQSDGRTVHIQGGTKEMERLVQGIGDVQEGRTSSVPELIGFASWGELVDAVSLDEKSDLFVMVRLVDKFGVVQLLSSLQQTVGEDDNPDIVLSTVHKAKGLEWEFVELSADLMKNLPENYWNTTRLEESELRLLYVAVTRARQELILPQEIRRFLNLTGSSAS